MAATAPTGAYLDCENGTASVQNPVTEPRRRIKHAIITSAILGLIVGVVGSLVLTPDSAMVTHQKAQGFSSAMSKAFVAPAGSAFKSNTVGMPVSPQMGLLDKKSSARPGAKPASRTATRASPTKPVVGKRAKPLSPGSNYPSTKNIQTQRNGFGTWLQKFQTVDDKSKYGVPIYLPNGNVNPAYLAAERKEMMAKKKKNIGAAESKRKGLVANKKFELADFIRKNIGDVGSNKDYYNSGK
jgi:hypothetical protein